jgi:hypothetical protein
MGQVVPSQHPAVVLRSHFNQLRALLAVALIAVISLTVAVVILATDNEQTAGTSQAAPLGGINYGVFNPGTGRPGSAPVPQRETAAPVTGSRYDGASDEGTRGPATAGSPANSPDRSAELRNRGPGFHTH